MAMTKLEKNIIDTINAEAATSKYGSYITISSFKNCINKYWKGDANLVVQKMLDKNFAYLSKSGKAITLARGFQPDFNVRENTNFYEYKKWLNYHADELYSVIQLIQLSDLKEQVNFYNKYYVNDFWLYDTHESPRKGYPDITLEEAKTLRMDIIMGSLKEIFYKASSFYIQEQKEQKIAEEKQKAIEEKERQKKEEESKIAHCILEEKEKALLSEGKYCVVFNCSAFNYDDKGRIEEEYEYLLVRYFNDEKSANDFSESIDKYEDSHYEYNYDMYYPEEGTDFTYKVLYSGKTKDELKDRKNVVLRHEYPKILSYYNWSY